MATGRLSSGESCFLGCLAWVIVIASIVLVALVAIALSIAR